MNVKERIISLKIIGKKQDYAKFIEEIGVTAVMKEKNCNLENGISKKNTKEKRE